MRQSVLNIRCPLLLAVAASVLASPVLAHANPVVSCIDGHIVEKLIDCPTVVPHRPPPQERGTGGPHGGGLLGGLLGGIL